MEDPADMQIRNLEQANPLREPTLRAAIAALRLASGTRGLDVGCGIGLQTVLLAEATRPGGQVTGLDISPRLLAHARKMVKGSPYNDCISFREGDMRRLPFDDNTFDWAWSADCVGYPSGDLLPLLMEVARVVRSGGIVALCGWSSQQLLPGHSMLEARLNANCSAYAPLLTGILPENHFMRSLRWFPEAGIPDSVCRTFVGEVRAPLGWEVRTALTSLLNMLWGEAPRGMSEADALEYARLCREESGDFILNVPEYYGFFTYTMFWGIVKK